MTPNPDLVKALTASVLPVGIGVGASDPSRLTDDMDPAEAAVIAGAVEPRKTEFHAGRRAARQALTVIGARHDPILRGADRAPVWPDGVTGSISHTQTACVAVVGRAADWAGLGVDLEVAEALAPDLVSEITTASERFWLARQPEAERGLMAKLLFSAKEATYKAQYTVTGRLFDFQTLSLQIDRSTSTFTAVFQSAQGPFKTGATLHGSYAHAAGLLVTGLAISHSDIKHAER